MILYFRPLGAGHSAVSVSVCSGNASEAAPRFARRLVFDGTAAERIDDTLRSKLHEYRSAATPHHAL
jgi:hypothetical protein